MRRRTDLKELANKLEIKAFMPPESSQYLAQNRVEGMVTYFHESITGCDWWSVRALIESLARSCYLQGVTDCAEAFARKKIMFPAKGVQE